MTIAKELKASFERSSLIRQMFEKAAQLKAVHGPDKVLDFTLGNPNLPPPAAFDEALKQAAADRRPGIHGYMPNDGYPETRAAVAATVTRDHGVTLTGPDIIMSCGAAGGLNAVFRTLLDPGDEVLTPVPYFVDYRFYVNNHQGKLATVPTRPDFSLDLAAMARAVTPQTKAVLINSPNNPTGQIYSRESLAALGDLLREKSRELGRTIYLLSDEPYRKIVFDGAEVPSILTSYKESIVVTSYSKDLSIPGERIGYIAVNPGAACYVDIMAGLNLAIRTLGFVNAPALMQRVVARVAGQTVDVKAYARKRELICAILEEAGFDFVKPPGTFYVFPKSPLGDDVKFVQALQEELILGVPGVAFGAPGHFRLVFCVADEVIQKSREGFLRVMEKF